MSSTSSKLLLVTVVFSALSAVACSSAPASGVPENKALGALSDTEKGDLCDWSTDVSYGGYDKTKQCPDGLQKEMKAPSKDQCVASYKGVKCDTPVSEVEACIREIGKDVCNGFFTLATNSACKSYLKCMSAANLTTDGDMSSPTVTKE